MWATDLIKVNPANGTQLANTGALAGPRTISPKVFITGTVQVTVIIQQINSTPAVVASHIVVQNAGSGDWQPPADSILISDGDSLKVIVNGAVVGQVQASIFV